MLEEKSILFICTGNIFRSLSAEQCFRQYLLEHNIVGWKVGSAGIVAEKTTADPKTTETLASLGITNVIHTQRKVSRQILDSYDVVVVMAQNHLDFLESEFGYRRALLFNMLAEGTEASIWDIEDDVLDHLTNRAAVEEKIERTIKHIHEKTPELFRNASERFYLFSDFVSGQKRHRNGYPFIALYETPNTLAFMSVDVPPNTDGHVLVIPKKRYADFAEVPTDVAHELVAALSTIGRALARYHDGYNILLNNGADAGQYIFHTHFHIVPRKHGDGIQLEGWRHNTVTLEEFASLNESLKNQIASEV